MDGFVNSPKVSEGSSIIRALEDEVSNERSLVGESVHEELDFIKDTNVILFVLNLEVAVRGSGVLHVNHVLAIDESGELSIGGGSSPGSSMDDVVLDNLIGRGGVGSRDVGKSTGDLISVRGGIIDDARVSTDIDLVSRALLEGGEKTGRGDSVGASTLE